MSLPPGGTLEATRCSVTRAPLSPTFLHSKGVRSVPSVALMQHTFEIRLRLHIDEAEIRPGDTPRETAERLLREIITVDDEVLGIHEQVAPEDVGAHLRPAHER
jgi:hypothetical protein